MTVPSWPDTLPRPLRRDYGGGRLEARQRKRPEAAPPGWRLRFSQASRPMALSITVSRAEKAQFDRFFEKTTAQGSLPFWMPDPVTDGWPMLDTEGAPILDPSGQPLALSARLLCVFGEGLPSESLRGVSFTIAFTVEILP